MTQLFLSINTAMRQIKILGNVYRADPKDIRTFEKEWIDNLALEIYSTSPFQKNLLVNITWFFDEQYSQVVEWIKYNADPSTTKIWLCGSVDSLNWIKQTANNNIYKTCIEQGYQVSLVGFIDEHWHSWFPYWLYKHNKNLDVPLITKPKYLYLSYNRKPRDHRKDLVEKLIDNNLLERGHVTFETGYFPVIDNNTNNSDWIHFENIMKNNIENYNHNPDNRYSRPEDLTSLGDPDIWNNNYLVIASESEIHDPYHISEKTWKPILGQRPFVLNSHPSVVHVLKKLGFYVPSDLFEDKSLDRCDIASIVQLIKKLYEMASEELLILYSKQYPMIEHNKNKFISIASGDRRKILHWSQIDQ